MTMTKYLWHRTRETGESITRPGNNLYEKGMSILLSTSRWGGDFSKNNQRRGAKTLG